VGPAPEDGGGQDGKEEETSYEGCTEMNRTDSTQKRAGNMERERERAQRVDHIRRYESTGRKS
jgi:hypothetical protein